MGAYLLVGQWVTQVLRIALNIASQDPRLLLEQSPLPGYPQETEDLTAHFYPWGYRQGNCS